MGAAPIPFSPPPGIVKTDSPLTSGGRWVDAQWVRFYRGKPQKMGGFVALTASAVTGTPRGAHVWADLNGRQYIAVGTESHLYGVATSDFVPVDITPSGFTVGLVNPTYGYGWGVGPYGSGTYGTARTTSNLLLEPLFWTLDNFGDLLLASPSDGPLYLWNPTTSPVVPAAIISGAPPQMNSFYKTAERFVIALGTNTNGVRNELAYHWCGEGDCTDWNIRELVSDQQGAPAGTGTVPHGTRLIGGTDVGSQISLMWTDTAVYTLQFTGSQFVFDRQLAALECGLAGPLAFVAIPGRAFWASANAFFMFENGVAPIPNQEDVKAWIFNQIPANYAIKTLCYFNSAFQEVWFLFVPNGATEPGLYAVYSLESQQWFTGSMTRTSATALVGDDAHPILTGTDGFVYQHEKGLDGAGAAIPFSISSGLVQVGSGASVYDVLGFYNDAERQTGPLAVQLTAWEHAMDADPLESETETVNPTDGLTDFRVSGRAIQVTISGSALGGDWRMGSPAFLGQTSGARR